MKKSLVFVLTILLTLAFTTGLFAKIQVGEAVNQKLETPHPYNGKGLVWEQEISWPGAGYIAIHFSQFDLAPGDYVEISDPAGDYVYTYKQPWIVDTPIVIGRVTKCQKNDHEPLLWDVTVSPVCNVEVLEKVAVIILSPEYSN